MQRRIPLPIVAGPTASGKTALAVSLAQRFGGEVVSADSMQIYSSLCIGTARPQEEELRGIPHHLLGFQPLDKPYSVARYVEDAHAVIAGIVSRGALPILCGGTGLYIQSLAENLVFAEEPEGSSCREELRCRILREGGAALLEELRQVDPETAARLHENDHGRIIRALEVYRTTGRTMAQQQAYSRSRPSPYAPWLLLLDCRERQVLYDRIDRRADAMLEKGLPEEAARVMALPGGATALQAIGYKELAPYLRGECTLEAAAENLKRGTRRYAKRQLSWFRRMSRTMPGTVLYIDEYDDPKELEQEAYLRMKDALQAMKDGKGE